MNAFMDSIQGIADNAEKNRRADSYVINGVRFCSVCHKPLEIEKNVLGVIKMLPIMCDCEKEELARQKEEAHLQAIRDAKRKCFAGDFSRLSEASITAAALEHPKEAAIARRYINNFSGFYADQQGLLLYGTNGTGKSFLAAGICNELIEGGHDVHFTTFSRIDRETNAGTRADRKIYLDSLNDYALLVLDDLGAERDSEYMQELVFTVIDSRYASGKPMIITTNLTMHDLKNPQTAQQSRIYDRVLQICYPVQMSGDSIRRKDTKDRYYSAFHRISADRYPGSHVRREECSAGVRRSGSPGSRSVG